MKWKENLKKRIIQNMWSSVCNDFIYRSKSACIIRHNWTFAFLYVFLSFYFWKISLELLASWASVFFSSSYMQSGKKSRSLFKRNFSIKNVQHHILFAHQMKLSHFQIQSTKNELYFHTNIFDCKCKPNCSMLTTTTFLPN